MNSIFPLACGSCYHAPKDTPFLTRHSNETKEDYRHPTARVRTRTTPCIYPPQPHICLLRYQERLSRTTFSSPLSHHTTQPHPLTHELPLRTPTLYVLLRAKKKKPSTPFPTGDPTPLIIRSPQRTKKRAHNTKAGRAAVS